MCPSWLAHRRSRRSLDRLLVMPFISIHVRTLRVECLGELVCLYDRDKRLACHRASCVSLLIASAHAWRIRMSECDFFSVEYSHNKAIVVFQIQRERGCLCYTHLEFVHACVLWCIPSSHWFQASDLMLTLMLTFRLCRL